MIRALAVTAAVLGLVAPAAAARPPAPLEPVEIERLPLPAGVTGMSHPDWVPDGEHIVFGFTSEAETGQHLGLVRDDGSGFRCLSCGLSQVIGADRPLNAMNDLSLDKPYAFGDGKRVLARIVGEREDRGGTAINPLAGPTQDFNFVVLECAPSVVDCKTRRLLTLEMPGGGLTRGVQNREARISPDSRHLAWTEVMYDGTRMSLGRLVRTDDHYELADVRVLNPAVEVAPPDPAGFEAGGPLYELKNFAPDGRTLTYASFATAENYDVWVLDLATGARRRLTRDLEWNEGTTRAPDNTAFVNFSSRTRRRMAPFAQLTRPTFIDFPVYVLLGRFALNSQNRKCLLSPWLVDSGGERGTYFGQPIDTDPPEGFAPHGNGPWNRTGTKLTFWEFNDAAASTPADPDSHLVVARLPARSPAPVAAAPESPFPHWAVPREAWRGFHARQGVYSVEGQGGGTATIRLAGVVNSHLYSVTYDRYSEDGKTFLSGTEAVDSPFTVAYGRWTADLTLAGAHTGHLRSDVTVRTGGNATGTLSSEYDGVRFEGLPGPACDKLPTPALAIEEVVMTRRPGRRRELALTVRADVVGDVKRRPVQKATVTIGSVTEETDRTGSVVLTVPAASSYAIEASAAGFVPAAATLQTRQIRLASRIPRSRTRERQRR